METKNQTLGRYQLTSALSNKNAGSCRWCFGIFSGREHFIKEFLEPKHPETDTTSSPEKKAKKLRKCQEFERRKVRIYHTINECSDGNLIRVVDFFRVGAKYYMAMPRIQALKVEVGEVFCLPDNVKRRICMVIAHAISRLHGARFVHADLKHSNIMFVYSQKYQLTAKVIDYDAGFFEDDPPRNPEAIAGDTNYFSPEVYRAWREEGMHLTCKMDIFSLGVLFHQYLTGKLPGFNPEEFESVGEAVSCGEKAQISEAIPADLRSMISAMLESDPNKRPTAEDVFNILSGTDVASYTVRHEVEGKILDTFTFRCIANEGKTIAVQKGSVSGGKYPGYKPDAMSPVVAEGEQIPDGTVITLRYVKEDSHIKTVSYQVVHRCGNIVLSSKRYSQNVWVNDPDVITVEESALLEQDFPGYHYHSTTPAATPGDKLPNGMTVCLNYTSDARPDAPTVPLGTSSWGVGDRPGQTGWRSMDRL